MTSPGTPDIVLSETGTPGPVREVTTVKLLNVGRDRELLDVRGAYLSLLGFDVVDALGPADAIRCLRSDTTFQFVVLCHTLNRFEKLKIQSRLPDITASTGVLELFLTDIPVTRGIRVEASTEFIPLMKSLAGQRPWLHSTPAVCAAM